MKGLRLHLRKGNAALLLFWISHGRSRHLATWHWNEAPPPEGGRGSLWLAPGSSFCFWPHHDARGQQQQQRRRRWQRRQALIEDILESGSSGDIRRQWETIKPLGFINGVDGSVELLNAVKFGLLVIWFQLLLLLLLLLLLSVVLGYCWL